MLFIVSECVKEFKIDCFCIFTAAFETVLDHFRKESRYTFVRRDTHTFYLKYDVRDIHNSNRSTLKIIKIFEHKGTWIDK